MISHPHPMLLLHIKTPCDTLVAELPVSLVVLPGQSGDLGILAQHTPLMTTLRSGKIAWSLKNMTSTEQGFDIDEKQQAIAEVTPTHVMILIENFCPLCYPSHFDNYRPNHTFQCDCALCGTYRIDPDAFDLLGNHDVHYDKIRYTLKENRNMVITKEFFQFGSRGG